jgi:oligopeptide/dipeptide ABC transporter ATP-binding protein
MSEQKVPVPLLEVRDLKVSFRTTAGLLRAVDGLSFTVAPGEVVGIVGESGSGKSVSMMSVMRLIMDSNAEFEGEVLYKGRDLMRLTQREMVDVRGTEIAMVFQDPMSSLNPVYRIGWQIAEQIRLHQPLSRQEARARAIELLRAVGIPHPGERVDDYPHQFSGGMQQRAMIAMALSCDPSLLIADEPTTALDVTVQAQILELIKRLRAQLNLAMVLITHDMGVIADIADRVLVMYAGRVVEAGSKEEVFYNPQHPYTWGLLASIARLDRANPKRLRVIPGQPPSLLRLPQGCRFGPRCAYQFDRCRTTDPTLRATAGPAHTDACLLPTDERQDKREAALHLEGAS